MLANSFFLDRFALKKEIFSRYNYLFIKILRTLSGFWFVLAQFLEFFNKSY